MRACCRERRACRDHRLDQLVRVGLAAPGSQGAFQRLVDSEILPEFVEGEDVAAGRSLVEIELRHGIFRAAHQAVHAACKGFEFPGISLDFLDAPEIGEHAFADLAAFAEGLDRSGVFVAASFGDSNVHLGPMMHGSLPAVNMKFFCRFVPTFSFGTNLRIVVTAKRA